MKYPEDYINKVINGDCLEVMKGIPDKSIDLVLTDPPYGVDWRSNRRFVKHEKIENDNKTDWLKPIFTEVYRVMKDDSLCVSFYGWPEADKFVSVWKEIGFGLKSHIVFVKNNMGLGWFTRGKHEPAYLLAKGKPRKPLEAIPDVLPWIGTGNEFHPTQKPLDSIMRLVETYSQEGGVLLDCFLGSGTTALAAKQLKRNFIGIELSEKYCKIANERLRQEVLL